MAAKGPERNSSFIGRQASEGNRKRMFGQGEERRQETCVCVSEGWERVKNVECCVSSP